MAGARVSETTDETGVKRRGVRRFGVLVAVLIFIADQATKFYVLYGLNLEFAGMIPVMPFVDFVLVWNRGISYGLFQQHQDFGRYVLIVLSLVISAGLGIWLNRLKDRLLALAIGFLIGGALGNVVDRLIYGAVVDFVLLHWGEWRWYVFNLADAAIVFGVVLLLYESWLGNERDAESAKSG
jgi:signal peptidase II